MPYIPIEESLKIGVLDDLSKMWDTEQEAAMESRKKLFHDVPWVPQYESKFVWKQDTPMPVPWEKGTEIPASVFDDVAIVCGVFPYGQRFEYFKWDAAMDQIGDLKQHAESGIKRYSTLYRYFYADYFNGTTNYLFYPQLAYDGAALFSANDGSGNDRMKVSGGNTMNATSLTTAGIKTDIHRAIQRWLGMKQPISGHPVFRPDEVTLDKIWCLIPPSLEERFFDLAEARILYTEPAINTAQSNTLVTKLRYQIDNLLTDSSDYYIVIEHPYWKPFIYRGVSSIESFLATAANSDDARKLNIEAWFSNTMMGCCPWAMFTIIKVNVA